MVRRGDVVVVDRLGVYRALGARAVVEARGATYATLPPYSPDLTLVEEAGAKIKEHVRGANAQFRDPYGYVWALLDRAAIPPRT